MGGEVDGNGFKVPTLLVQFTDIDTFLDMLRLLHRWREYSLSTKYLLSSQTFIHWDSDLIKLNKGHNSGLYLSRNVSGIPPGMQLLAATHAHTFHGAKVSRVFVEMRTRGRSAIYRMRRRAFAALEISSVASTASTAHVE